MGQAQRILLHLVLRHDGDFYRIDFPGSGRHAAWKVSEIQMDIKHTGMGSNLQRSVSDLGRNGMRSGKQYTQYSRDFIHNHNWYNSIKMADIVKTIMANLPGLSVYVLAFLANLGNIISVTLGVVGVAVAVIKALKLYEDYQIRKIERRERQRDFDKGNDKII